MASASSWDRLVAGVELPFHPDLVVPSLHEVTITLPDPPPVVDVHKAARYAVIESLAGDVRRGMTVAVGAGSRGLSNRVELVGGVIAGLRELGAEPFVVPAMGSHGGATAAGQREMLEHLGMTEAAVGAEIRATMETVEVARTPSGMPLYLDLHAAGADRILPVNRIKPHTCFKGPIESGLAKMAVVGFGKQPGAAQIHSCGPIEMRDRIIDGVAALKATGRVLGGVGSIEGPDGRVVRVEGLTSDQIGSAREIALVDEARTMVPALPFGRIDVLIIEQIGKDISGTSMDPNVTGRFWVHGLHEPGPPEPGLPEPGPPEPGLPEPGPPEPGLPEPGPPGLLDTSTIVALGLTEVSGGNVLGIGLADFIPVSLAIEIDWRKTYLNCFTAGPAGVRRSRMPMVLPDEEACIKAALSMCGRGVTEPKRVVRIRSTLHLTRAWVSDAVLADLHAHVRPAHVRPAPVRPVQ